MRMFITSKNKYLSNDMKISGTCSIPLSRNCQNKSLEIVTTKIYVYFNILFRKVHVGYGYY